MSDREARSGAGRFRTFKYLHGFVREWSRLELDDEALRELELLILANPDAGAVMAGTGGLRKLRFTPSKWKRGKSGALRIGYSHRAEYEKVLVIAVYAKTDQQNLTASERRNIKQILDRFWLAESR